MPHRYVLSEVLEDWQRTILTRRSDEDRGAARISRKASPNLVGQLANRARSSVGLSAMCFTIFPEQVKCTGQRCVYPASESRY